MVLVIGNHNLRDDVRKTTEKLDGLAGRGGSIARDLKRRHIVLWFVCGLRKLCVTKSEEFKSKTEEEIKLKKLLALFNQRE